MSGDSATAWLEKAGKDVDAVRRSLMPLPDQNLEIGAYHIQQAAEKALKALLVHLNIPYPRRGHEGHDLAFVASRVPPEHALAVAAAAFAPLTDWATEWRYPGEDPAAAVPVPTGVELERWLAQVESFIKAVTSEMNPPTPPAIGGP